MTRSDRAQLNEAHCVRMRSCVTMQRADIVPLQPSAHANLVRPGRRLKMTFSLAWENREHAVNVNASGKLPCFAGNGASLGESSRHHGLSFQRIGHRHRRTTADGLHETCVQWQESNFMKRTGGTRTTRCQHPPFSIAGAVYSAFSGAAIGGGGVVVASMLQAGRMPPATNVFGAAAFMSCVLGFGSFVR